MKGNLNSVSVRVFTPTGSSNYLRCGERCWRLPPAAGVNYQQYRRSRSTVVDGEPAAVPSYGSRLQHYSRLYHRLMHFLNQLTHLSKHFLPSIILYLAFGQVHCLTPQAQDVSRLECVSACGYGYQQTVRP